MKRRQIQLPPSPPPRQTFNVRLVGRNWLYSTLSVSLLLGLTHLMTTAPFTTQPGIVLSRVSDLSILLCVSLKLLPS